MDIKLCNDHIVMLMGGGSGRLWAGFVKEREGGQMTEGRRIGTYANLAQDVFKKVS